MISFRAVHHGLCLYSKGAETFMRPKHYWTSGGPKPYTRGHYLFICGTSICWWQPSGSKCPRERTQFNSVFLNIPKIVRIVLGSSEISAVLGPYSVNCTILWQVDHKSWHQFPCTWDQGSDVQDHLRSNVLTFNSLNLDVLRAAISALIILVIRKSRNSGPWGWERRTVEMP